MIRWITGQLGTAPADTLPENCDFSVIDVRDLVDKPGNRLDAVRRKIEEGAKLLANGRKVVVCCDFGVSRSNAVAAGILARTQQIGIDAAIRTVLSATGETEIKLELLSAVRRAIVGESRDIRSTRRILVTGADGFIGRSLLRQPLPGYECVPIRRSEIDLLKDVAALDMAVRDQQADVLLHLASPRAYSSNEAMGQSVTMLKNVLDVCRENSTRLVFLSSWEVYSGYKSKELLASEETPLLPGGNYGQSKYLCEVLLKSYRALHGLQVLMLRCSPVYGPGADRPKFIHTFLQKARQNQPITTHRYRNGFPAVDLLFIDDLLEALRLGITGGLTGDFNLGSGEAVETRNVAASFKEMTGSTSDVQFADVEGFAYNIVMDTTKAKRLLHWNATVSWREGLKRTLADILAQNSL